MRIALHSDGDRQEVADGKAIINPIANVPLGIEEIIARCEPAVAVVRGPDSAGSGFLVAPGLLATNAHVIRNTPTSDIRVLFPAAPAGQRGPHRAEVVYLQDDRDLAILAVDSRISPLALDDRHSFRKGQEVVFIGNPVVGGALMLEIVAGRGIIGSQINIDGMVYYQLSGSVNGGNSGGPVVDMKGRVIGVVTARAAKEEGFGFCAPAPDLAIAIKLASSREPSRISYEVKKERKEPRKAVQTTTNPVDDERLANELKRSAAEAKSRAERLAVAEAEISRMAAKKAGAKRAAEAATRATELLRIAQLLEKQGETRPALNNYRDLVEDYPDTPAAKVASSRIDALDQPPNFSGQDLFPVNRIIDETTIVVSMAGKESEVRLLGLAAFPKKESQFKNGVDDRRVVEALANLLDGKSVYLAYEPGFARHDSRGHLLAFVYRSEDRLLINRELIFRGLVNASAMGTFSLAEEFRAAEARARSRKMGLWGP